VQRADSFIHTKPSQQYNPSKPCPSQKASLPPSVQRPCHPSILQYYPSIQSFTTPPTLFAISSLPPPIAHCAALLRVVKQKLRPGYLLREKAELAMGGRFDGDVWGGGGGLKDDFGWGGAGVNGRREGGK